jgi:uncharacterized protein YmfQ (DUF2313 family)
MFEEFIKRAKHDWFDYLHMLRKLLPKGEIWGWHIFREGEVLYDTFDPYPKVNDSTSVTDRILDTIQTPTDLSSTELGLFCSVPASELARLEERAYDLISESVPGLSNEMLDEWYEQTVADASEQALVGDDDDSKRQLAHAKVFRASQTANAQYFIDYAETLGFTITVNENPQASNPFICGVSKMGLVADPVTGPDIHAMGGRGAFSVVEFTVTAGDGNYELMQELFRKDKPAHVVIVWIDARP